MWYDPLFLGSAAWFGVPAVLGTGFFTIRTILGFAGVLSHGDVDGGHDHGGDGHPGMDGHHHSIVSAAEVFSVQSIAAFAGAFGWAGLIARESFGTVPAAGVGLVAGVAMSAAVIAVFRQLRKLESDGTVTLEDLLGQEGVVYVGIPGRERGMGQVRIRAGDMEKFVNAVSRDTAIATGGRVLVVATNPDNSVVVQALNSDGDLIPSTTSQPPQAELEKGD